MIGLHVEHEDMTELSLSQWEERVDAYLGADLSEREMMGPIG
jgi:hypothetical protein